MASLIILQKNIGLKLLKNVICEIENQENLLQEFIKII